MTLETKNEIKQAWENGSYSEFAKSYLPMAGQLVEANGVDSGDRVLESDVGRETSLSLQLAAALRLRDSISPRRCSNEQKPMPRSPVPTN